MDLTGIKLVAADMDGTLLNGQHELSPDFFPLFHRMKAKGILFAAASGRQYYNLVNKFEAIRDEVIYIAENGSYVVYRGEDLFVQAMEPEVAREQLLIAKDIPDAYLILCGKKCAYVQSTVPIFLENVEMYYDRYEVVEDLCEVTGDQFLKIAICDLAGSEANSYNYFRHKHQQLQIKISGSIWLDISHLLANKGNAIRALQTKYNITPAETMVFGDYLNDLEMIQQADFSFAMENAHPDIIHAARYLAKSNENNGVTEVLQQMLGSMP